MKSTLTFLLLFSIAASSNANENNKELRKAFKTAYSQYQQAEQTGDFDSEHKYAEKSYQIGKQLFGNQHLNTANLSVNWASTLLQKRKFKQARELLESALPTLKKETGKYNLELVPVYQKLAESYKGNFEQTHNALENALDVLEENVEGEPILVAELQTEVGIQLFSSGSRKSKILVKANETLNKHLNANDKRVILSNFYVGKYYMAAKRSSKAIDYLNKNISVFEQLEGATHPLELSSRAFLIQALEKNGDSEEAIKHCIAIGKMRPWDDNQQQTPLYRLEPRYPQREARDGIEGWVQFSFTVTPYGFVEDIELLDSSGNKGFIREAKKAVKKWRYAPKFENGKPIAATSTLQLDFKLGSS